ncbi:MAG: hypothetical protein CVT63_02325 [Candidatus Anoxymicrobium japonicum]|uniref:Calcineurin-like phosphoesterase domain-containing protein n=1 Tax=Candidatus Anoxymicrobium japonicum TaxID=2013648 RepID=A0A2N3G7D7_9ACTN|nr:MAG: hypothetical protein CVT63_02325 [Candidatus Anoxymicrobium japonicum]
MAVKILSDIHGEYDALVEQLKRDDIAVLLGDYLNLIDFRTQGGILAKVYSQEEVQKALDATAGDDRELARRRIRAVIGGSAEKNKQIRDLAEESYEEFFSCLPCKCFMLYGNTDGPDVMDQFAGGKNELVESGVVMIEGERFGMVSGAPRGPWSVGLPGEMKTERYDAHVTSLGPVDVLCTHYPPAVGRLTWDTVANRDEAGSEALLEYIKEHNPSRHYFGHVHNPKVSTLMFGGTRMINAGLFKEHKTALIHPAPA